MYEMEFLLLHVKDSLCCQFGLSTNFQMYGRRTDQSVGILLQCTSLKHSLYIIMCRWQECISYTLNLYEV